MTGMAGTKPFLLVFLPRSLLVAMQSTQMGKTRENLGKPSLTSASDCFLPYPTPLFCSKAGKKRGKGMSLKIPKLPHKSCYLGREP